MDLGFETIGNATLICHDRRPVLATDPWLEGSAYFGSWVLAHVVPEEQQQAVRSCKYLWISHGHPDHLHFPSLESLRDKEILLPDHVGGRIARSLVEHGFKVRILPDATWTPLSDRIRVASISNIMQDAALFVDVGGTLVIDANDSDDRGAGGFIQETVPKFERSFLLWLTGYGDADMINYFDESGNRILPPAAEKQPVGPFLARVLETFGIRSFIPFSSMHRYQRTDSAWANAYTTPITAHADGFESEIAEMLPAFIRYDAIAGTHTPIDPPPSPPDLHPPEAFGDRWSDELEPADLTKIRRYFDRFCHLKTFLGFLNFRVGGRDHHLDVNPDLKRGIAFETPRSSLLTAVEHEVFDDLLIGNFMRTTLHGDWGGRLPIESLYPDFTPFISRYGDNGGAHTAEELRAYFAAYRVRPYFTPGAGRLGEQFLRSIAPYEAGGG